MSFLYAFASVMAVSLVSFIGILSIGLPDKKLRHAIVILVAFSAGALLGDVFLHLLPEAVEESGFSLAISIGVLAGILVSFVLEKFIHWHHCHTPGEHHHPIAYLNLFGDAMHNLIDGIIIGASYIVSVEVGIATTIAVLLHEIPQEIGDYGVLVHAGFSQTKALLYNGLSALCALIGVVIAYLFAGSETLVALIVPFAAGNFIYLACADIIPELHKELKTNVSVVQFVSLLCGIGLMSVLLLLE